MPTTPSIPTRVRKPLLLDRSGGADQSAASGTDINKIVAQYRKHGTISMVPNNSPLYGDFSFPEDIHSMREYVENAEDGFMQLPAKVRTLCDNDWEKYFEMYQDPEQRKMLEKAGLETSETPTPPVTASDTTSETPPTTDTPPPTETPPT